MVFLSFFGFYIKYSGIIIVVVITSLWGTEGSYPPIMYEESCESPHAETKKEKEKKKIKSEKQ